MKGIGSQVDVILNREMRACLHLIRVGEAVVEATGDCAKHVGVYALSVLRVRSREVISVQFVGMCISLVKSINGLKDSQHTMLPFIDLISFL